jgi:transposase
MWKAAVDAGGLEQVANNLGISKASCAVKASNMRKAGYDLPQFRRGRPKKNQ